MKLFENLIGKVKPHFEEGGKLEKFYYGFDALETFLFVPGHESHGTHIKDGIDLKRTMFTVVIAMIPALLFGMWNVGHQHFLAIGEFTAMARRTRHRSTTSCYPIPSRVASSCYWMRS